MTHRKINPRTTAVVSLLVLAHLLASLNLTSCQSAAPTASPTRTPQPTFTAQAAKPTATTAPATATTVGPTSTVAPPTVTPLPPTPEPKSLRMKSPEYGMQAFLWWRPEVASRDMGKIKDAGFTWVKQNIGWRDVEATRGQYDWSRVDWIVSECNKLGLDLLVRIDAQPKWAGGGYPNNGPPDNMADLGNFLLAMATRYEGRIRAYEIWNEPNLAAEWGGRQPSAAGYVAMLKVAYRRIKEADPDAMVVTAGLSPTTASGMIATPDTEYLKQMYAAGMKGFYDAIGVHAAGYKAPPEMSPDEVANNPEYNHGEPGVGRIYCFRHAEDLRKVMVDSGDANSQVIILEFGWTIDPRPNSPYYWHSVLDPQVQADYLVRAYQYAKKNWSPWIGLMSLIYIANPDWTDQDEKYWWAISTPGYPDFKPRPAYTALTAMPK